MRIADVESGPTPQRSGRERGESRHAGFFLGGFAECGLESATWRSHVAAEAELEFYSACAIVMKINPKEKIMLWRRFRVLHPYLVAFLSICCAMKVDSPVMIWNSIHHLQSG